MLRAGLVFEGLACCKIRKTEVFLGLKRNQNADHCFEFSVALKVSAFAVLNHIKCLACTEIKPKSY